MCSTTGPKIFGPPTGVVSGGTFAPPVNYASSPQATANVGGVTPPTPPAPPTPPMPGPAQGAQSQLKRASQNPFTYAWGGGGARSGVGPISRLYNS